MSYDMDAWIARVDRRPDIAAYLTHLTRATPELTAVAVLVKILEEQRLRAAPAYTYGGGSVVCFQDAPLSGIYQNLLSEKEMREDKKEDGVKNPKRRYNGVGLRLLKHDVFSAGGRPVIYERPAVAKKFVAREEWWRIVGFDLEKDPYLDWTHEREWRVPTDLPFDRSGCQIVLGTSKEYREFIKLTPPGVLHDVDGIHILASATN